MICVLHVLSQEITPLKMFRYSSRLFSWRANLIIPIILFRFLTVGGISGSFMVRTIGIAKAIMINCTKKRALNDRYTSNRLLPRAATASEILVAEIILPSYFVCLSVALNCFSVSYKKAESAPDKNATDRAKIISAIIKPIKSVARK